MNHWYNRNIHVVLVLVAILVVGSLAGGCGKKPEAETDPTIETTLPAETVPAQPTPEPTVPEVTAPDYAAMDPADYGIGDVFFGFDEYTLSTEAMGILSRNARILREAGVTVLVSGHCDERGTVEYNLALGEKRAKAVKDYLVSLGVAAGNVRVTSYGESKPFATGSTEQAWAQNRRAHFERP
ncbi:MAG: OmpA family protein [Krumholzibacteria bacterium]|nr:OmpA family protein [Candidatus Krumholzibacteria bacterium]